MSRYFRSEGTMCRDPKGKEKWKRKRKRKRKRKEKWKVLRLARISCSLVFPGAVTDREERRRSTGISHDALIKRTSLIRIVRLKRNHEQGDPFAEGFGGLDGREERREADTSARDTPFCCLFFSSSFSQLGRSFGLLFRPSPS